MNHSHYFFLVIVKGLTLFTKFKFYSVSQLGNEMILYCNIPRSLFYVLIILRTDALIFECMTYVNVTFCCRTHETPRRFFFFLLRTEQLENKEKQNKITYKNPTQCFHYFLFLHVVFCRSFRIALTMTYC
jgi:hypothetical protein